MNDNEFLDREARREAAVAKSDADREERQDVRTEREVVRSEEGARTDARTRRYKTESQKDRWTGVMVAVLITLFTVVNIYFVYQARSEASETRQIICTGIIGNREHPLIPPSPLVERLCEDVDIEPVS